MLKPPSTNTNTLTPQKLLAEYGETERLCREAERKHITSISRSRAWELEKQDLFPKRRKIGNTNAWLLSELLLWAHQLNEGHKDG